MTEFRAISEVVIPSTVFPNDVKREIIALTQDKEITYETLVRKLASTDHRLDMVRRSEIEDPFQSEPGPYRRENIQIQQKRRLLGWKTLQQIPLSQLLEDARREQEQVLENATGYFT